MGFGWIDGRREDDVSPRTAAAKRFRDGSSNIVGSTVFSPDAACDRLHRTAHPGGTPDGVGLTGGIGQRCGALDVLPLFPGSGGLRVAGRDPVDIFNRVAEECLPGLLLFAPRQGDITSGRSARRGRIAFVPRTSQNHGVSSP